MDADELKLKLSQFRLDLAMWLALKIGGPAVRSILFRNMALAAYCLKTLDSLEIAKILVETRQELTKGEILRYNHEARD